MIVNNTMGIRKQNIELVRNTLLNNNGLTKNEICLATELSLASCTNILKILIDSGEIKRVENCESTGGRRAKRFYINEQHELVLTIITLQEDNQVSIDFRVVDLSGKIVYSQGIQSHEYSDGKVVNMVDRIMNDYVNIKAIGISVAGILEDGHIHNAGDYVFELGHLPTKLEERFGLPTVMENDLNLAVLGYATKMDEYADKGIVVIDRGLGAGVYVNGQVLRGATHFAGEIMFYPEDGMMSIFELEMVKQIELLGKVCTSFTTMVNPGVIAISGYSEDELNDIQRYVEKYIPKVHLPKFKIVKSKEEIILSGIIHLTLSLLKKPI